MNDDKLNALIEHVRHEIGWRERALEGKWATVATYKRVDLVGDICRLQDDIGRYSLFLDWLRGLK